MIEINLLPADIAIKGKQEFALPALPSKRVMITFAVIVVLIEAALGGAVFFRKGQLSGVAAQRKTLEPAALRIQAVKTETTRLQTWLAELDQATMRRIRWTRLTNAVSDSMTNDVWLTKLWVKREVKAVPQKASTRRVQKTAKDRTKKDEAEEKNDANRPIIKYLMVLNGSVGPGVDSTAAVGRFIKNLETNPVMGKYFSKVWLEKIDRVVDDAAERFDFTVSCLFTRELGAEFDGVF